jgi:hypothetical protein
VTDNGLPPLSDTQSFAVVVAPPPFIQSIIRSNNSVRLTWSAISGQTYRVQYKPGLGSMVWLNLLPDVTATGPFASKSDPINAQVRRFYRVMVLP